MKLIRQFAHARRWHCLLMVMLSLPLTAHTAKPMAASWAESVTTVSSSEEIDFSELDRLVMAELKRRRTPQAR